MSTSETPLVLFDGVCNLCNGAVTFLIDHDPKGALRFASLQSATAKTLLADLGANVGAGDPDTMLLVENGRLYDRSTAALRIAKRLPWPLKSLYALILVPRPIRDRVYAWVARNRYRWFGRAESCRVPTPELRARFVD